MAFYLVAFSQLLVWKTIVIFIKKILRK